MNTSQKKKKTFDITVNSYYFYRRIAWYSFVIPKNQRVLHLNCGGGAMLAALHPSVGVGVDTDETLIASARTNHPEQQFYEGKFEDLTLDADLKFDYVILDIVTMKADDVETMLAAVFKHCHQFTRVIVDTYMAWWRFPLKVAQLFGYLRPEPLKNWLNLDDLNNILYLSDLEVVVQGRTMFVPFYIPIISYIANVFIVNLPLINRMCMHGYLIARPAPERGDTNTKMAKTVSVIVPCKNEKGNIEPAVKRIPAMGDSTEIIFVEGNSTDGTLEEIKRVATAYPEKKIRYYVQDGRGKGDAVRKGFTHAHGNILMIQDGDLTIEPEELPKFYDALVTNKGELINGARLIYDKEKGSMRLLNGLANRGFALIFSWLLAQTVKDTLAGTKVLWKQDYELIRASRTTFGSLDPFGDFDLLFGAAKLNLAIVDVPVHYKKRTYGETQISRFSEGFVLLRMSFIGLRKFKFR